MPTVKNYQKQQEKQKIAYDYFISQGYSPEASAGIVGNLVYESGLNTSAEGDIGYSGGSSFGIAQFRGKRLQNLKKRYGDNWTDFGNQLDFVRHELETTHQKAGNLLRNTRDVYEAGQVFSDLYEIPAKKYKNNKDRQNKVNKVYSSLVKSNYTSSSTPISDQAIANVNTYFDSTPTTDVKDLPNTEEIVNFEEEPEVEIEEKEVKDKDIEEVQKQTAEYNFLEEYKSLVNQERSQEQVVENTIQEQQPQQNLTDIYNQVSEFIDSPLVAQQGGKVYVNNVNDPRYKSYLDSLKLYQGTQRTLKELESSEFKKEEDDHLGVVPANTIYKEKNYSRVGFGDNFKEKGNWWLTYDKELQLEEAKKYLKNAEIKPQSFYKTQFGSSYYRPIYKKPEEEVLILNRQKLKPVNNLNSEGLVDITPNESFSEAEILNQYIQPKYWDVQDDVNQNFGGSQTNYRVYPETADEMLRTMAPEPYNKRTVIPYYQTGGTVQNSKDFLQNWYKDRILPDTELNQAYQNEKQQYINQSQYLPNPNYVDKIDDENTQGIYDNQTGKIDLLKTADPLVYTHEATHKINLPLKDTQSNVNAFSVIGENVIPQEKIENQWVKDNYEQISNYQEVIPRLQSYRQLHDLKPDQVITPELIQQNRDKYNQGVIPFEDNTDQLYKLFQDEGLSNVLNKVVSTNNTSGNYAQQGKLIDNLKKDFGSKPKQMYLPEGSAEYKRYKEQDRYFNPEKRQGITTGDWKQDLLYQNDWLLDTPIVGQYIKDEAKKVAIGSEAQPFLTPKQVEEARKEDPNRKDYVGKDRPGEVKGATLVDQYFSEKPLYPNAKYKPTSDYLEFLPTYSLKENFEKNPEKQAVFNKELTNFMFQGNEKGYKEFIKNKKPVYRRAKDGSEIAELLEVDLGGHKTGAAWDEELNLPYVSVSDAWDFEPTAYAKKWDENSLSDKDEDKKANAERSFIQAYLMHKSGKPFKIYDRFYFDPKTKKYIPDSEIDKLKPKKQTGGEIEESIIEIKPSSIEGKGVFVKKDLKKGEMVGLAHTNDQPSTDLGRMHNHSETPNSESIKEGNNRYIVALRPLKKGEEITVDYRKQPELEQPEYFKELTENEKEFLKYISKNNG